MADSCRFFFCILGFVKNIRGTKEAPRTTVGFLGVPGSELGCARKDLESQDANLGGEAPSFGGFRVSTVSRIGAVAAMGCPALLNGGPATKSFEFPNVPLGMI
jgi:hypothetical protein